MFTLFPLHRAAALFVEAAGHSPDSRLGGAMVVVLVHTAKRLRSQAPVKVSHEQALPVAAALLRDNPTVLPYLQKQGGVSLYEALMALTALEVEGRCRLPDEPRQPPTG